MQWNFINSLDDVESMKDSSHNVPQVLLKHSTTCSISAMAKMRIEDQWKEVNQKVDFNYLDLLRNRSISNVIAEEMQVHHESPQLLLLVGGEVIYDASHFDISIKEINESLDYHFAK